MNYINDSEWKICVENLPIYAIDLIIYFKEGKLLMGKRINNPAKDYLFVPGGRILKNETREKAFERISKNEVGSVLNFVNSKFIGIYEHFYDNSKWVDQKISTHYIVEARLIKIEINTIKKFNLSNQHNSFELIDIRNFETKNIHPYSLKYIKELKKINEI
tara:strand:- start:725 stop:1207 length:483 start_codon:yes stop_codon:yes gene_type:complete